MSTNARPDFIRKNWERCEDQADPRVVALRDATTADGGHQDPQTGDLARGRERAWWVAFQSAMVAEGIPHLIPGTVGRMWAEQMVADGDLTEQEAKPSTQRVRTFQLRPDTPMSAILAQCERLDVEVPEDASDGEVRRLLAARLLG